MVTSNFYLSSYTSLVSASYESASCTNPFKTHFSVCLVSTHSTKKKYFYVLLARSALWHPCKIASKEWKGMTWKKRFLAWFGVLYRHFRIGTEGETMKTRRHDGRSPGLHGYQAREPAAWPRRPVRDFEVFMLRTKNEWRGSDWTRPVSIALGSVTAVICYRVFTVLMSIPC